MNHVKEELAASKENSTASFGNDFTIDGMPYYYSAGTAIFAAGSDTAKNQVCLIANGREVTTTVDTIKDMDHRQVYNFILGRS